jgi:hypothetical protein
VISTKRTYMSLLGQRQSAFHSVQTEILCPEIPRSPHWQPCFHFKGSKRRRIASWHVALFLEDAWTEFRLACLVIYLFADASVAFLEIRPDIDRGAASDQRYCSWSKTADGALEEGTTAVLERNDLRLPARLIESGQK